MDREAGGNAEPETGAEAGSNRPGAAETRGGTGEPDFSPAEEPDVSPAGELDFSAPDEPDFDLAEEPDLSPAIAADLSPARPRDRSPARAPDRAGVGRREPQAQRGVTPAGRPAFSGLSSDPRLPIWIARGLVATAAGVAVLIWQNWRWGLTAAAAVIIVDTIYRARTTSVIPAAVRVTSAQRRTRRRLVLLRSAGYVALNARAIPGSDSIIDHLVIGPAGVFAVDSERWDRRLPVRTAASGRLYHGPFPQEERLEHAIWEAAQASSMVGAALGTAISVRPAMAIYGPTIPWTVASLRDVDVFAGRRLRKYFKRQARKTRARLGADQISAIHAAAARTLPPAR